MLIDLKANLGKKERERQRVCCFNLCLTHTSLYLTRFFSSFRFRFFQHSNFYGHLNTRPIDRGGVERDIENTKIRTDGFISSSSSSSSTSTLSLSLFFIFQFFFNLYTYLIEFYRLGFEMNESELDFFFLLFIS